MSFNDPSKVSEEVSKTFHFRGHLPLKASKLKGAKQIPCPGDALQRDNVNSLRVEGQGPGSLVSAHSFYTTQAYSFRATEHQVSKLVSLTRDGIDSKLMTMTVGSRGCHHQLG